MRPLLGRSGRAGQGISRHDDCRDSPAQGLFFRRPGCQGEIIEARLSERGRSRKVRAMVSGHADRSAVAQYDDPRDCCGSR